MLGYSKRTHRLIALAAEKRKAARARRRKERAKSGGTKLTEARKLARKLLTILEKK